jgi:perosamine synthetase
MKSIPLAQPEITKEDIDAVTTVLTSKQLSRGPKVAEFEQAVCNLTASKFACAVSSGTVGLIIALQALGVKAGDEVITPSFTVPATVNSIVALGAKPVMVDIEAETYGIDPNAVLAAITAKTKAIIVVHVFGQAAKIQEILSIARQHKIKVIEDACEAIGNNLSNQALGTFANVGVFAFYPNKQITTGEGGMLVTNNKSLHQKFLLLRNHGRSMNGDLYDQICHGWNARLSDINAALGLSQLLRIKQIKQKRQKISQQYQQLLSDKESIICPSFSANERDSAWFVYVLRLMGSDRDKVFSYLKERGIQCGRYFAPVHLQPYYRNKFPNLDLPITQEIAKQCLALPFYTQIEAENINYICDTLLKTY